MHPESATRPTEGDFAWHLEASERSVAEARNAFREWLGAASVSTDDIADLAVVLSELASNAVAGSGPAPGAPAEIHAGLDASELWLEVSNTVPAGDAHVFRWDLDDPLRTGGRGLMIVRAYTDTMHVDSVDDVVTVRCTRRLEPGP